MKNRTQLSLPIASVSILPATFIVIDLETTGLDPLKHQIIEIGAIKVSRHVLNNTSFQALVKPAKKIPKKITEITGITQQIVDSDGVALDQAISDMISFIGKDRLVTYNAKFDMAFLRKAATQCGRTINNPVSCALLMARRAWPDLKSYRLTDVAKAGGLTIRGAHRALDDCQTTVAIYSAAASKLQSIS